MGEKLLENSMNTVLLVFDWLTIRIVKICFPKKRILKIPSALFFKKKRTHRIFSRKGLESPRRANLLVLRNARAISRRITSRAFRNSETFLFFSGRKFQNSERCFLLTIEDEENHSMAHICFAARLATHVEKLFGDASHMVLEGLAVACGCEPRLATGRQAGSSAAASHTSLDRTARGRWKLDVAAKPFHSIFAGAKSVVQSDSLRNNVCYY